jgi:hypothetical protein
MVGVSCVQQAKSIGVSWHLPTSGLALPPVLRNVLLAKGRN